MLKGEVRVELTAILLKVVRYGRSAGGDTSAAYVVVNV